MDRIAGGFEQWRDGEFQTTQDGREEAVGDGSGEQDALWEFAGRAAFTEQDEADIGDIGGEATVGFEQGFDALPGLEAADVAKPAAGVQFGDGAGPGVGDEEVVGGGVGDDGNVGAAEGSGGDGGDAQNLANMF